jgi:predicted metal-dependent TIM-barrel fold hydrolase
LQIPKFKLLKLKFNFSTKKRKRNDNLEILPITHKIIKNFKTQDVHLTPDKKHDEHSQIVNGISGHFNKKIFDNERYTGIIISKRKITLKDTKKIVSNSRKNQILHNAIKFVASDCGIARNATRYCNNHKIRIIEIENDNIRNLFLPFI